MEGNTRRQNDTIELCLYTYFILQGVQNVSTYFKASHSKELIS